MANFFRKVQGVLNKASKYDLPMRFTPGRKKYFDGLNKGIADYMDPDGIPDPSKSSYVNAFTGETVKYKKGGRVRGDGCCTKGKTKGRFR